jgi:3-phenylpropionate/cinnamic acid dioxygenase small subunit
MTASRADDRLAIQELLARYSWALCDRDFDAWQACFTPEAHADYTTAGGIAGTPAEAAAWLATTMSMFETNISHGGNVVVDFDGDDSAKVRSIYKMIMKIGGETPTYMEACGYYNDTVVRTADGWRIADRFEQLLYIR